MDVRLIKTLVLKWVGYKTTANQPKVAYLTYCQWMLNVQASKRCKQNQQK